MSAEWNPDEVEQINVNELAVAYRRLVLWFGAQLLLNCGARGANGSAGILGALIGVLVFAGMLATVVALSYYAYRTARALGSSVAWVWAIAMFVPCANAITLVALSSRATAACRRQGVPVGLLGPQVPQAQPASGADQA